jgi:DNA replication ATP-dependent helicase Dna2
MLLKEQYPSVTNEFIYSFEKSHDPTAAALSSKSLLEFQFNVGDPVVISTEQGHLALAIGFVRELTHTYLVLTLDRELRGPPAKKKALSHEYVAIDDPETSPKTQRECGILYRIDKDELTSGMGLIRWTLINLLTMPECRRLRSLVIELSAPEYRPESEIASILKTLKDMDRLNMDQREALHKVLAGILFHLKSSANYILSVMT